MTQKSIINKAQSVGGSKQGIALDDEQCAYLVAAVATDLRLRGKLHLRNLELPPFFGRQPLESLRLPGVDFLQVFEQLVVADREADAYFDCLASLHKARLKHERDPSDTTDSYRRAGWTESSLAIWPYQYPRVDPLHALEDVVANHR